MEPSPGGGGPGFRGDDLARLGKTHLSAFPAAGTRADPSRPWQRAQFSAKLASKPPFSEKLKQEIRLARQITRRYALRTHYFGECDGIPYMSMEYLKGLTLRSLLDGGGACRCRWCRGARQMAEGLEAAHAVGVVHLDIKPVNILFDVGGTSRL
jgi:serine/threonine protein kinase